MASLSSLPSDEPVGDRPASFRFAVIAPSEELGTRDGLDARLDDQRTLGATVSRHVAESAEQSGTVEQRRRPRPARESRAGSREQPPRFHATGMRPAVAVNAEVAHLRGVKSVGNAPVAAPARGEPEQNHLAAARSTSMDVGTPRHGAVDPPARALVTHRHPIRAW